MYAKDTEDQRNMQCRKEIVRRGDWSYKAKLQGEDKK